MKDKQALEQIVAIDEDSLRITRNRSLDDGPLGRSIANRH